MPESLSIKKFLLISLALHVLLFAAALFLQKPSEDRHDTTPVQIANLPRHVLKRLPPVEQKVPPVSIPSPKRFGEDTEAAGPKAVPEPDRQGREKQKQSLPEHERRPLPFLTQKDLDRLARKGMPPKKPGEESVTLDTDEFKFISYNRWLKVKVESILRYPELAAITGLSGVAYIRFDIMQDGSLGHLELLKSSGYKILDDEALNSIRGSAPFQPLPEDWSMDRYTIRAAVIFYLSSAYVR